MTEAELLLRIYRLCAEYNVIAYHEPDSRLQIVKGWPDLVLIGQRGILFRELKSVRGTLTADQRRLGSIIYRAGGSWAVWRPVDLLGGHIRQKIEEIA